VSRGPEAATAGAAGGVHHLDAGRIVRRVRGLLRPHRAQVVLLVLLLFVDAGFSALVPLGIKYLVDYGITPRDGRVVTLVLSLVVVATILVCAAAVRRDWVYAVVGNRVLNDLRLRMFDQLQRLSPEFFARTPAGSVMSRFSTDLAAVDTVVTSVLPWAMMGALGVICSVAVLFFLQWQLTLLTLAAAPLSLLGPRLLGPRARVAGYGMKVEEAAVASAVQEALHGQAVVRVFGLEATQRERFRTQLDRVFAAGRRFGFLSGLVQRTPNLAVDLVHAGVLAAGAVMAFRGTLSVGSLVSFDLVFRNFANGVAGLTEVVPGVLRAAAGLERIEEILEETPRVSDAPAPRDVPQLARAFELRNVSFGYTPERRVLEDVTLSIPRGASVALVGRSGSGKSSLVQLLLRFHDPVAGAVTLDGTDIREFAQSALRARVAVVFQESFLFDTTVRENIRAGRLCATDEEVAAAARAAELDSALAELPGGLDAPVGERGSRLSGGQRQRVAIARALLRHPDLLVLDEATSALDPATETALEQTLAEVSRGRTVVSVTHRLASVAHADRIFVLDGGRLVEQGRHEDLLRRGGVYADLWRRQAGFRATADWEHVTVDPERLRLIPLLEGAAPALLADLAERFAVESVPAGRAVISQGEPGDRFYLIARGSVVVTRRDDAGQDRAVATLDIGDYFGEIALLRDVPRTASVRTLVPCVFLTLRREPFLDLVRRWPDVLRAVEEKAGLRASAHR
jgi:ATP-binding cassette subfamily B protein